MSMSLHPLAGRVQDPAHVKARADGLRKWWATQTEKQRTAHMMLGQSKRLKTQRSSEYREKMRGITLRQFSLEPVEAKKLRYAKKSATVTGSTYKVSASSRERMSKRMSSTYRRTVGAGKKWGACGWNKGIPMRTESRLKSSISHKRNIRLGLFRPPVMGGRYKRKYVLTRLGRIRCDSGWEITRIKFLASDKNVVRVTREPYRIPYRCDGIDRIFIPDYEIGYRDGTKILEEIKPAYACKEPKNIAKIRAAKRFCKIHGLIFRLLQSEVDLKILGVR